MKTAREILLQEYGGSTNFMTPNIVKRGKVSKNIAYEISSGTGFRQDIIYGVSIVAYLEVEDKTKRFANVMIDGQEVSSCHSSLNTAMSHIEWLKGVGEEKLLAALKKE